MADCRRRQLRSCDPCRKGKRGCDAPKNRKDSGFSSCSNCQRWKKECTFNWLSSKRTDPKADRRGPKASATSTPQSRRTSVVNSHGAILEEDPHSSQWYPVNTGDIYASNHPSKLDSAYPQHQANAFVEELEENEPNGGQSRAFSWNMGILDDRQIHSVTHESANGFIGLQSEENLEGSPPDSLASTSEAIQQFEDCSYPSSDFAVPECNHNGQRDSSTTEYSRRSSPRLQEGFCLASNNTATKYVRATMTRNLIRIYHDSMENALSCWLTEHNCPYSSSIVDVLPHRERREWGPSWSNRMCIRVCRLDRASSSIRGRALSAAEDRAAARALHLAIMAFASQWTQHAQKGAELSVPAPIAYDERSIRERVWNEARHALEHSTGIPSFRIAFANIIFSLTQSPLDDGEDVRLDQLLESDRAPIFLENANRQLFTFRHKLARLKRGIPPSVRESRRGSLQSTMTDILDTPKASDSSQVDSILANNEHRNTLGLLFWLGVMFDTLSAAMYQRPLVVSDEDSQIASAPTSTLSAEDHIDLDSWNPPQNSRKQDVWGDFFLRSPAERPESTEVRPRWPCSYETAASILSEATPVKVLLYRRVTQLQNLIYRGASAARLEEVIQKTLLVYQHWNCTYQRFMLDCVANHEMLPPRIQSWYVILDGHWHLAAMLLADVIESIDHGRLGSDTGRQARQATELVSTLRIDNALAVGALARSSLQGQEPAMYRHFHDSVNEVAFLVEPWTVVLIHSFAKAGYICFESFQMPGEQNMLAECFQQNCEFCIRALQYLGRKSDMAFLVARNLSRSFELKLRQKP